jgi:hypothetical protein
VRLDGAGTINGTVTDAVTGAPVDLAAVGLTSYNDGFGPTQSHRFTDEHGRYTIPRLGPYRWALFFRSAGHAAQFSGGTPNRFLAAGVKVRAWQTTPYDQALRRGVLLSARVVPSGPDQLDFARLTVVHPLSGDELGSGDCVGIDPCEIRVLSPQLVRLHYHVTIAETDHSGYHDRLVLVHRDPTAVTISAP